MKDNIPLLNFNHRHVLEILLNENTQTNILSRPECFTDESTIQSTIQHLQDTWTDLIDLKYIYILLVIYNNYDIYHWIKHLIKLIDEHYYTNAVHTIKTYYSDVLNYLTYVEEQCQP